MQVDLVTRGGPSLDRVQAIEAARTDRYSSRTITKLERVLEWEPGSVRQILSGGDPTPMARSNSNDHASELDHSRPGDPSNVAGSGLVDESTQQAMDATMRDLDEIERRLKTMKPAQVKALLQFLREARMGVDPDNRNDRAS